MSIKDVVDCFSGGLMPLIAILTWLIYRQQIRVERQKLELEERRFKRENYDKRLALFHSTMQLLSHISEKGNAEHANLFKFMADTHESYFLCGEELHDYLWELYKRGLDLNAVNAKLQNRNLPETERSHLREKEKELWLWFGDQVKVVREKFGKHLRLDN